MVCGQLTFISEIKSNLAEIGLSQKVFLHDKLFLELRVVFIYLSFTVEILRNTVRNPPGAGALHNGKSKTDPIHEI